jgi:glycosyltransferase involved in cell wall biosynthesis
MKIALVGTAAPYRGGIAHWNMQLAEALAGHHTVEIFNFRRQYPGFLFPGSSQFEDDAPSPAIPAPRLVDSMNPLNWISVGRRIRRSSPDLIIFRFWLPFFGPCFGTIARVAKRGSSARVLFVCDNVLPHERRPFDRALTRYAFRQADAFLVQSASVEKELLDFWPGARYRTAPHPVYSRFGDRTDRDAARGRLGLRGRRVVLFFGYVRAYKGLDVLLEAIGLLDPALDVELVVAGEFYEDRNTYDERIRALPPGTRVTVHAEYTPTDRVRDYFSAADVVVLPYRSATQSGIAQIAYNFDVPVIASDVGGLAEVVKDGVTGSVVPPGDARALANSITAFFGSGVADRFRQNVRAEKSRYSWEHMVRTIEGLAEEIR